MDEYELSISPPYDTFGPIMTANFYASNGRRLESRKDDLTKYTRFFLNRGFKTTAIEYALALGQVDKIKVQMTDLFEDYDLLLSPTACFPAFEYGQFPGRISSTSTYPDQYWNGAFTLPINVIGHPASSIPAGFSSDSLPIGLQIVGRKGDEETVIAASAAFERARPWTQHRPPIH